jgi:hypothetical protein
LDATRVTLRAGAAPGKHTKGHRCARAAPPPIPSVFVTGCAGLPSPGGQARPRDPKCAIAYAIASDSIVAVGLSDCAADAPCGLAWRVLPRLRLRCNRFRGGRIVSVCRVSGAATSPTAKSDDERQVGAPIWGRVLAAVVAVVLTPQRSHRARRLTSVINYPAPRTAEPAHGSAPSPKPRSIP